MTTTPSPYAVIGATGQQGGAVLDAPLAAGAPVRALVRDDSSTRSRTLADRGVAVVPADQDDPASLVAALSGVSGLFMMTTFTGPGGVDGEVEHGRAVVAAASEAGVPRVVYSSVGGAERHTGIPHFESKRRVEETLAAATVPSAVVRPTFFMDNLAAQLDGADEVVLRLPLPPDVALQMVAVRGIGIVAATVLLDPDRLPDGSIEIAGDELTGPQMAERIARRTGKPARYVAAPVDSVDDADQQAMFRWFSETPAYAADPVATRRLDPDLLDFDQWLATLR